VRTCVVSPGSRSTPLVAALVADGRFALPTIIDERAAAFYALGIARATNEPCALVCTSGSAAAHYLPAFVEAAMAGIPLIALTADRPPELQHCGASQTIDQVGMYGRYTRAAYDLGAPDGSAMSLRAVRRTVVQAITAARGPLPGPVHLNVPLRKPLEPALPKTDEERGAAKVASELRKTPFVIAPPRLAADRGALEALSVAIAAEPRGVIVAGALPANAPRDAVFALAARAGYPILAEAGSQLRFGARPGEVTVVDFFDLALASGVAPTPRLVIQLGSEPVAQAWPVLAGTPRFVLTDAAWHDPDGSALAVIAGELGASLAHVTATVPARDHVYAAEWRELQGKVSGALDRAIAAHPRSESAVLRAALEAVPADALVQIGNSLPIRVIDHVRGGGVARTILTQRGAAGIDGLIASAAGATSAGKPVLLVLGDVSFAHDVGGLLAAREVTGPLAIVVIDNGGGRIFHQLPYANVAAPSTLEQHWTTPPRLDPTAVATAFGIPAITAAAPAAVGAALASALATRGPTIIHAPVSSTGALDVRRDALDFLTASPIRISAGVTHV
jgi:2-succinyl-5-enolpyruvyl-6-hydroxy-3-cyclohexene-1-carboxylate synthase